jgi:hypothetical protein
VRNQKIHWISEPGSATMGLNVNNRGQIRCEGAGRWGVGCVWFQEAEQAQGSRVHRVCRCCGAPHCDPAEAVSRNKQPTHPVSPCSAVACLAVLRVCLCTGLSASPLAAT